MVTDLYRSDVYGTSPLKRVRYTKTQLAELDAAIYEVCKAERPLTIRGCFYRVMSKGLVEKTEKGYGRVQRRALDMRRRGDLPYHWIADGTRYRVKPKSYSSVDRALADLSSSYRRSLWDDQGVHVEVWVEKDAITSVINPVTWEWDVPIFVARGFASETFLYSTAQDIIADDKPAVIYQLGDHDPSGLAAWEHTRAKLEEFAPEIDMEFHRLAVTLDQIEEYELPTRPTKKSDTRAAKFVGESVEVDAMPSTALRTIVRDAIESWIDQDALRLTRIVEANEREGLENLTVGSAA
jgi:hypothetical protein